MQRPHRLRQALVQNAVWLAGSLALAFLVWVIATFQSDPIEQRRFSERIAVQMTPPAGLLIVTPKNPTATVVIRAPRSVLDLLTREEITISADLNDLHAGEHTVELRYDLARQPAIIADISPRVLRITLEESATKQIPLRASVSAEPPVGYAREQVEFDVNLNQVAVSGAASQVASVAAAQVILDLSQQRNPVTLEARLIPVDADGLIVPDVTLTPAVVQARVDIRRRDDVREVSVRPNIQGQPPEGYVLNALSYSPQTILVSGSPSQLADLPDTLVTEPINLTNRTASFEVTVPVVLPQPDLLLLTAQAITVSVEINTSTISRQFDGVPVEIIGLETGLSARAAPNQVTVLVTGPQPILETLKPQDIRVAIDLNGLEAGNHSVGITVSVGQGTIPGANITVLPAEIDVEIVRGALPTHTPPR